MNQRDRIWTTLIIWGIFGILILLTFDRLLLAQVNFAGLWPPPSGYPPMPLGVDELNQIIQAARAASPTLLANAQESIRLQLAQRFPLVMILATVLIAAATACTFFVWRNAGLEAYLAREVVQAEKAKRRSRIEQFVEDLDSDELDQLRNRISDTESLKYTHEDSP